MTKLHVRKGDTVVVVAGKDTHPDRLVGKVIAVDAKNRKVMVEKAALVKKHQKPTQANPQGGIMTKESYIDASNVMVYCTKCRRGVRTRREDGGRICVKCGSKID